MSEAAICKDLTRKRRPLGDGGATTMTTTMPTAMMIVAAPSPLFHRSCASSRISSQRSMKPLLDRRRPAPAGSAAWRVSRAAAGSERRKPTRPPAPPSVRLAAWPGGMWREDGRSGVCGRLTADMINGLSTNSFRTIKRSIAARLLWRDDTFYLLQRWIASGRQAGGSLSAGSYTQCKPASERASKGRLARCEVLYVTSSSMPVPSISTRRRRLTANCMALQRSNGRPGTTTIAIPCVANDVFPGLKIRIVSRFEYDHQKTALS